MILERIKEYIDYKGITIAAFERSMGMSNASFGKSLKTGGSIGSDKLENILIKYPEINSHWLLTGKGEMLRAAADGAAAAPDPKAQQPPPNACPLCHEKEKLIQAQQRTIDILERELHHSKALFDDEREKGHPAGGQKRKAG
ncbi:MAG TPA: hypothetical protein VLH56_18195 [Dissulfurispiraceae bacterium]|nr:hypothetical protein [Dissulfurispiraceae bacterium]